MRAIGFKLPGSIDREDAFSDIELPTPKAEGRDLLIEVKAVSVNPVDTKMRKGAEPSLRNQPSPDVWRVLGWDAAGVVSAVGPDVTLFQPGETVFYAGTIGRSGTNAEYHLVDERIVGHKPESVDWGAAAALPLTSLTAWELLFAIHAHQRRQPEAGSRAHRERTCPGQGRPRRLRRGDALNTMSIQQLGLAVAHHGIAMVVGVYDV
jgi:NADPH:quinone reductase-like Zn-dependent oxidoreductase